jgi:transposase-like protein
MEKSYPTDFKIKVVLDILIKERSLDEVASSHEIDPVLAKHWEETFLENSDQIFGQSEVDLEKKVGIKALKKQVKDLYRQT